MDRYRLIRCLACFALLFVVMFGFAGDRIALAAQEMSSSSLVLPPAQQEVPEEELTLETKYPVLSGESGEIFEFSVDLIYKGSERKGFDLSVTAPTGWAGVIVSGYPEREIPYIELEPRGLAETVKVMFASVSGRLPEPSEYVATFEVSSGDLRESIDLKAVVTARYEFIMTSGLPEGNLNPKVTAGKDYHMPILLINSGTAGVENITFSSSKPEGWDITYSPDKIDLLEPGLIEEVDVVITPPSKTIAGDYRIYISAEGKEFSAEDLELRVTVETSTIWGGAGVAIVVAVIAGLIVMFMRLGRR